MKANRMSRWLLPAYGFFFLFMVYGPTLMIPLFSFNDGQYVSFPIKGFTLKHYETFWDDVSLRSALFNSLKVGIAVAIISTLVGLMAAIALTHFKLRLRGPIMAAIIIPLVIPAIILGIGNLSIMRQVYDIDLSLWTIGAGHLLICIPYSLLVLISRLEGFDKSLGEASADLGESGWMTFWRVTFPLALPGIVSSLLTCFSTSFDEYVLGSFLSSSEQTLPMFIYGSARFPQKLPPTLALASIILVVSFILLAFAEWFRRRGLGDAPGSGTVSAAG